MDTKSGSMVHVEDPEQKVQHVDPVGTVRLIEDGEVVLIPTPSPDPRGKMRSKPSLARPILTNIFRSLKHASMEKMGHHDCSQFM